MSTTAPWSPSPAWSAPDPRGATARSTTARSRLRRVRRAARRARRPLAALLLALATGLVTHALLAPSAEQGGAPVVVASRDLPAGAVLAGATSVVVLPAPAVPQGAIDPAATTGAAGGELRLTGPVRRGEVLTDVRVAGAAAALASLRPGEVALPVGLAQPLPTGLLTPGQRVSVLAAGDAALVTPGDDDGAAPGVLARGATVLAVDEASPSSGLLAGATGPTAVVLALDDDAAARVAAAAAAGGVVVALSP